MLSYENIQDAMQVTIAMSNDMAESIYRWSLAYQNEAAWIKDDIKSLQLPSVICQEMSRLITMESSVNISGSNRANFIKEQMKGALTYLPQFVEFACAKGGIVFKPYPSGGKISIDVIHADNFFPVSFNSNREITAAIFPEFKNIGKKLYTRLEYHSIEGDTYKIQNRAFYSESASVKVNDILKLGTEIPLAVVSEWEDVEPYIELGGLEKPLFSYFQIPLANNVDPRSPLGVSVFSRSLQMIRDADEQYGAALWEYRSKETAVQAGREFFDTDRYGNVRLPVGKERMYFALGDVIDSKGNPFFNVYSPDIRDESFFNGLNEILRRVEFNSNLAYGTLSDPNNVDRTAEEIKASKQRSYSAVKLIQGTLDTALKNLVYAIDAWTTLEELAPEGEIQIENAWDDSVVVDKEQELASMQQDVTAGIIRKELYIAKKYGVSEEEAKKMMPQQTDDRFNIQEE